MPAFDLSTRKWDVFISYASEDAEDARRIRDMLRGTGWKCFLAEDDLQEELHSKSWARGINEALDEAGVVLTLMSPAALESQWVRFEWESFHLDLLRGRKGGLIPCCIKELDADDLGRTLQYYQAVDFRDSAQAHAEAGRLLSLLETYLGQPIGAADVKRPPLRRILNLEGGGVRVFLAILIRAIGPVLPAQAAGAPRFVGEAGRLPRPGGGVLERRHSRGVAAPPGATERRGNRAPGA